MGKKRKQKKKKKKKKKLLDFHKVQKEKNTTIPKKILKNLH